MFKSTFVFLFCLGFFLLSRPARALVIPFTAGSSKLMAGHGWDSRNRIFRENCVQGTAAWAGAQESSVFLDHQVDETRLQEFFEASVAARMNLLFASGELKLSATHRKDSETITESLIYAVDVHGKDLLLTEPTLNGRGHEVHADPAYAREVCGDQLITRVRTGGQLFIKVNFDFYDEKIRNEWKARFKFSVLGISKTKSWQDVSEDVKQHTFVNFTASQLGGDPALLKKLLAGIDKTRCRLAELEACSSIINRLLWYAQSDEQGGFRSQIDQTQTTDTIDWNKVSVLSYEVEPYQTLGIRELAQAEAPQMTPMATVALTQVLDERDYQSDLIDRAALMIESFPLQKAQKEALDEARNFPLRRNLSKLRQVFDGCMADPRTCPNRVELTLQSLEKVDRNLWILIPSFYTQCMSRGSTSEFDRTMTALLALAQTDDCALAQNHLISRKDFDLSRRSLVDITALRYLNPTRLNLAYNAVRDLRPLNLAAGLEFLNIRDNQIDDLHTVLRWPRLQQLNAVFNRITSVAILQTQTQIKRLALHGNLFADGSTLVTSSYDYLSLDSEERCTRERDRFWQEKKISKADYLYYQEVGFAPVLNSDLPLRWANCRFAVHTYEE